MFIKLKIFNFFTFFSRTIFFFSPLKALINADSRSDANDSVHIIEVIESESITLPCNLTNTFGYDIKWSYNGEFSYFTRNSLETFTLFSQMFY